MTDRPTYTVRARRSGKWWALDVPSLPGAYTQVRRLDQVDEMIRDAIAAVTGLPEKAFDVTVEPELDPTVAELMARADDMRQLQATAEAAARELTRQVAHALVESCALSTRDVGQLLGVSHQRISQVMNEATRPVADAAQAIGVSDDFSDVAKAARAALARPFREVVEASRAALEDLPGVDSLRKSEPA